MFQLKVSHDNHQLNFIFYSEIKKNSNCLLKLRIQSNMGLSDKDLILIIVLPIFAIFLFFFTLYLIYYCKCCRKKQLKDEDNELLVSTESSNIISYSSVTQETTFMNRNDINLMEKVKIEKLKKISESRDAAFVFLQFFIRSNPSRIFKSIDHLLQFTIDRKPFRPQLVFNQRNNK